MMHPLDTLFYGNYTPSGEKILIRKERGNLKSGGSHLLNVLR
jgi:hypothetical protein